MKTWTVMIAYVAVESRQVKAHQITGIETARDASDARKTIIEIGFLQERMGDTLEIWIAPSAILRIETLCYEAPGQT